MNAARLVVSLLGIGLIAAMPFVTASCGKKACFRWTEAEGSCPSQDEASAYFGAPGCGGSIRSVDGDADYDGELCCYDVTEFDNEVYEVCTVPGSSVGPGGPATSSSVSTGTFTGSCDGIGDCGDSVSGGCVQCAVENLCVDQLNTCQNQQPCLDFVTCLDPCGTDQVCIDACVNQFPEGAQLYNALLDCVMCAACPIDCATSGFVDPIPGCQ